jgi:hypothetical protein
MGVRLCALAFLAIGCLLCGGSGVALAGDPASSDDSYAQSGAPAAHPDDQDQPDATNQGGEDQPDATDQGNEDQPDATGEGGGAQPDEGGADDQSDDGAMSPDDENASPNDEAPQDDQPE